LDSGLGGGISNLPTNRKRYSSSFGYRYSANSGAGNDGSPGSGPERKELERPSVSSGINCFSHALHIHILPPECLVHE
jgi:hypothetical protein